MERSVLTPKALASPRAEMVAFVESELAFGKTFPFLDQRSSGEEYAWSEKHTRYGSTSAGYEVLERSELIERGAVSWTTERTEVVSFGPDNTIHIRLSYDERSLVLEADGPPERVAGIRRRFHARFDEPPSPELLASAASAARSAVSWRSWAEARALAESVLVVDPDQPDALLALGIAAGASGDAAEAKRALEHLLELDPRHVDAAYNLGNLHAKAGDWAGAAECYARALELDATNHPAAHRLGTALEQLGRRDDALTAHRRAVATSPNPGGTWGYSGLDFTAASQEAIARLGG